MKKTNRKKIVSIIGMISIRAFLTVLRESRIKSFHLKCLTEPLQEIFSRQGAKSAKKIPVSPNLACFASLRESPLFRFSKPILTENFKYLRLVFPFLLGKQQLQTRAVVLDLFQFPFGAVGEVVVGDERENGDQETRGGGDQGLGHAAGDRMGLSEARLRHNAKGTDHAGDGSQ